MRETTTPVHAATGRIEDPARGVACEVGSCALQLVGCDAVDVYVYDEPTDSYVSVACLEPGAIRDPGAPVSSESASAIVRHSTPVAAFESAADMYGPLAQEAARLGAASTLVIRCDRGPRALGLLMCAFARPRQVDAGDERNALALARIVAMTLDYARRTSVALDRADRLATLLDTASAFAGELDLESLFAAIHDQVRRYMDAPVFVVVLESGEGGALRTEYAIDSGVRVYVETVLPGVVVREVYASALPVVADPLREGNAVEIAPSGRHAESALYVPMRLRDRVIGVVAVQSFRPGAYGPVEVELMLELAEQAATAIQNAGMFREERRRMNELAVLHRLAALTNSEAHLDRIFPGMEIIDVGLFRVTRDADFSISDEADDLLGAVEQQLRRRRFGDVVRLEIDEGAPKRMVGTDRHRALLDHLGAWFRRPDAVQLRPGNVGNTIYSDRA